MSGYSRFEESQRSSLLTTTSTLRLPSTVKGSPVSTWCGISSRLSVRKIAWRSGWCWFTCSTALGQMRACRVSSSTASQQGHLTATCSSILIMRLPMATDYDAGMRRASPLAALEDMRWILPLVGSSIGRRRRPSIISSRTCRSVPAGVPSPAAGLAKLCVRRAGPGDKITQLSVRLTGVGITASCAAICRPLGGLRSGPPLHQDPIPTIPGRFLPLRPSLPLMCLESPATCLRAGQ